jgi:16S rRNA (guanine527-N7)-methyltransferase
MPELSSTYLKILTEYGLNPEQTKKIQDYISLLWSANDELNLVSRKMTFEELIENHVIDCLLPINHLPLQAKLMADLGSGGGLPGVIYAIIRPNTEIHLYEKSPLKRQFLSRCQKIAPNLKVCAEIPSDLPKYDFITARGFKPIDVILDMTRKYYESGGSYFLLKARLEKINEEFADAKKKFKNLEIKVLPLRSPVLDVERNIVIIGSL